MTQQVKASATKPDDRSSVLGNPQVQVENQFSEILLLPTQKPCDTQREIKLIKCKNKYDEFENINIFDSYQKSSSQVFT